MGMTSLAIVGSRSFTNYVLLKETINQFYPSPGDILEIVSGGAKGADSLAERYARENNIRMIRLRPKWRNDQGIYNPRAGFDRNKHIVSRASHVVAFWDKNSRGTLDSINYAKKLGKRLDVIEF